MEKRIYQVVPEIDLRVKMDAMVHDLTQALEETNSPTTGRLAIGFRRRTRSAGNIALIANRPAHSDDSICEKIQTRSKEFSTFIQSDSDEVSANSQCRSVPYPLQKRPTHLTNQTTNFESDSVNENFSPKTGVRRKRKMKRMDLEPMEVTQPRPIPKHPPVPLLALAKPSPKASLSLPGPSGIKNVAKKKKVPLPKELERFDISGKRKRSVRERSSEGDVVSRRLSKSCRVLQRAMGDPMAIDRELMSSSSLSSSESDAGIQTNDEGREGDDEQSDWTRAGEETDIESDDTAFHLLNGSLSHMAPDARQAYSERIEWLKEDIDREIRGGRRRVHGDRASFSVLTSANEKLSMFLQDCDKLTLRLHPMEQNEQEQLRHLVNLYSLRMRVEESCPVLSKTTATPRSVHIDPGCLCTNDFKKRRKHPQPSQYETQFPAPDTMDIS